MKKIAALTFSTMLLTASCATVSPRVGQNPAGTCTRDLNPWGHASQCSCDDGNTYDERAGLCLDDSSGEKITVRGRVAAGIMAIGGETTGFIITTAQNTSYELILSVADQEKLMRMDGRSFEIKGELIIIESVERKERRAIIADKLTTLQQ